MEEMKRELSLDEMDRISGGAGRVGAVYGKTTAAVKLRNRAGSTSHDTILTTISKGATVEIIGRSSNHSDWLYVSYNGRKGFVPDAYVTTCG